MPSFALRPLALLLLSLFSLVLAADDDGYVGYELNKRGDPNSAIYETRSTKGGVELPQEPDVYLNASVSVGEINIEVENITAKVNLDAKVLNLLHFTAGVDAKIDRVRLNIQDVKAKVYLEARLENVVAMVDDVLNSIDLNPIIATLGNGLSDIVDDVGDTLGGGGGSSGGGSGSGSGGGSSSSTSSSAAPSGTANANAKRGLSLLDYNIKHNILFSTNDYSGNAHSNRVLGQNGTIYDQLLNNNGDEISRHNVGYYKDDMSFTGHNRTITIDGVTEYEMGYFYNPYSGLEIYAVVYQTPAGRVVKTKIVSEAEAGGTSTISPDKADVTR